MDAEGEKLGISGVLVTQFSAGFPHCQTTGWHHLMDDNNDTARTNSSTEESSTMWTMCVHPTAPSWLDMISFESLMIEQQNLTEGIALCQSPRLLARRGSLARPPQGIAPTPGWKEMPRGKISSEEMWGVNH